MSNIKCPSKKILVFITHSLGEIDALMPLFACIKKKYKIDIEVIFTVKKIYYQYLNVDFYKYCSEQIGIKITYCRMPNKFDPGFRKISSFPLGSSLLMFYFLFLSAYKFPFILSKLLLADAFMHEHSNQKLVTNHIYRINRFLNKPIFAYVHGQSFNQKPKISLSKKQHKDNIFLMWHENNEEYVNNIGYTNLYTIGFTKFYNEWIQYLFQYDRTPIYGEKIVLIYSRAADHKYFMDKDKYIDLFITSYNVIRNKMGDIPIVIKPHPREDTGYINYLIKKNEFKQVFISKEHPGILAKNAALAISFWTSAILDSLSIGVPSVEFYIEAENFRIVEPSGSMYRNMGIHSVDNGKDLGKFIDSVISGNYVLPQIVKDISNKKDIGFMEMI